MKRINDETLNKYIDGELDGASLTKVNDLLMNSEEDRNRLQTLQIVHSELKKMKVEEVAADFTSRVMNKVKMSFKAKRKDRYFIWSIISIFLLCFIGILGYLTSELFSQSLRTVSIDKGIEACVGYCTSFFERFDIMLRPKYISIVGSIFSLVLLITGYFFFESTKQKKNGFGKVN